MKPALLWLSLGLPLLLAALCAPARAEVTLGVTSPAARFSPATWAGDAGRGGSASRTSWNNGAWCEWRWTTPAAHPAATFHITNPTRGSAVSYFLDGALTDNSSVPASGGISVQGLTGPGPHTLRVYLRNSPQSDRWHGANACTVTGLTVDDGAKPLPSALPDGPKRPWVLIVGDSITEGIQADNGRDDTLSDYSFLVGEGLKNRGLQSAGYDTAVSACGYSGWLRPGDARGDVPGYFLPDKAAQSRWNRIDANTSLLDTRGRLSGWGGIGEEPTAILINYGVNECLSRTSTDAVTVSVTGALTALRRAAPSARVLFLIPPGLADPHIYPNGPAYIAALNAGFDAYHSTRPADTKTMRLDFGLFVARALGSLAYGGGVHPNAAGHAFLAPILLRAMLPPLPEVSR